jgi:energy-coupling factor transport system permease protein
MQAVAPASTVRGSSWLHRLDPVAKLAWLVPFSVFSFTTYRPLPLLVALAAGLLVAASAGILRPLLRIMVVFTPIAASIIVIQALAPATCGGPCTAPVPLGPLNIYDEGLTHGISLLLRVTGFQVVAFTLLLTTHPSDLFASLARLKVPYLANFMLAMTLQLVPVLQREVGLVIAAQRARGMRGTGFGALIPSFVPVAAGAVERVGQLAISLEARAFGSSGPKTSYRRVPSGPVDAAVGVLGLVSMTSLTAYGIVSWGQAGSALIAFPPAIAVGLFLAGAVVFVGVFAVAIRAMARL